MILPLFLLVLEWPDLPLSSNGLAFYIKINVVLKKMLNLGFPNFRFIFLKILLFLVATLFCNYGYLFKLIFTLLTFRNKAEKVLAGLLLRSKILWYV